MIIDINVILARRRRRKFGQLDLGKTLVCKNSPLVSLLQTTRGGIFTRNTSDVLEPDRDITVKMPDGTRQDSISEI